MPRTSATGKAAGFTLLELVVVVAVLALLTVAIPVALPRLFPAQQLRVEAENLSSALRDARAGAVLAQRAEDFSVDADAGRILGAAAPLWNAPAGFSLAWEPDAASDRAMRFFPDGSVSGGALRLGLGTREARIELSPMTGRISVVTP